MGEVSTADAEDWSRQVDEILASVSFAICGYITYNSRPAVSPVSSQSMVSTVSPASPLLWSGALPSTLFSSLPNRTFLSSNLSPHPFLAFLQRFQVCFPTLRLLRSLETSTPWLQLSIFHIRMLQVSMPLLFSPTWPSHPASCLAR